MRPGYLHAPPANRLREPGEPHKPTRDLRARARAGMVLPAAEQGLVAAAVAPIVRQDEGTTRRWSVRHLAERGMAPSRPQRAIRGPDPGYALEKGRSRRPAAA